MLKFHKAKCAGVDPGHSKIETIKRPRSGATAMSIRQMRLGEGKGGEGASPSAADLVVSE